MIFITGATGFLGHNLIPRLAAAGYRLRALARPSSDTAHLEQAGAEIVVADDVSQREIVRAACRGCDIVIHAAGHFRFWGDLPTFWQTNVAGTLAVLEAADAAGVGRFVHVSTAAVVGRTPDGVIDETTPPRPLDHYQRTKLEAETAVLAYHRARDLPVIVLRPGAFYGPWGHYAFNRLFFEEPLRGWRIRVNNGRHITFPAYTPDVAGAILLALDKGRPGEIYNVCGRPLSHNAVNAVVGELAGIHPRRLNAPVPAVLLLARLWTALSRFTGREPFYPIDMAPYVFQDWRVSSEKAKRELGFRPTPFVEGAAETLRWYWDQGLLKRPAINK